MRRLPDAPRPGRAGPGAGARHPLSDGNATSPDLWHPDRAHPPFRGGAGHRAAGLRRHRRARQIPDAGGGHRVIEAPDLQTWPAIIIALPVLVGRIMTLVGATVLILLPASYARRTAPKKPDARRVGKK